MIEELDFETYLSISKDKFEIFLFDKKKCKNLYKDCLKFNDKLDGKIVKIPGYIVPLDYSGTGVTEFMLVPYVGACIHVPPPPPNQLVYVTTDKPWDTMTLWEPVWVTGEIVIKSQTNEWAETGYEISADKIEFYDY